jgi:tetratricopeptide (TPR) repeat protein
MNLTIDEALQQGISAHKEGKLEEAERAYRSILASVPQHPDANHNLGVLAVGVGQIVEALPHFKTALEANPKQGQYWLSYIDALIKLGKVDDARLLLEQGKRSGLSGDAVNQLDAQLNVDEDTAQKNIDRLLTLYNTGNLKQALDEGTLLLQKNPGNHVLHNILGAVHAALGNNEAAIKNYGIAIQIKPDFPDAYLNRGVSLRKIGLNEKALSDYNKALELDSLLYEAHNNIGHIHNILGNYDDAIERLSKAIELRPSFSEAYNNLGDAFYNRMLLEDAYLNFQKAVIIKPEFGDVYNNLGNASYQLGDMNQAYEYYQKAIQISPDFGQAYANKAHTLKALDDISGAIESHRKAIQLDYKLTSNIVSLCLLLQKNEDYEQAIDVLTIDVTKLD